MGLDITAYEKLTFVRPSVTNVDYDYPTETPVYVKRPDRADGLVTGIYRVDGETFEFRAGSYSGYNAWRAWLCRTMLQKTPEYVWSHLEDFVGKPFIELIDFSDCEGTIGSDVCAKLAHDFAAHRNVAERTQGEDDYNLRKYDEWHKAFVLASSGGAVAFH
jgi:hypothetical protein